MFDGREAKGNGSAPHLIDQHFRGNVFSPEKAFYRNNSVNLRAVFESELFYSPFVVSLK